MIQEIKDFRPSKNIIMACLITGIYDVNRSETLENDKYELVQHWAESLTSIKLNGLIFIIILAWKLVRNIKMNMFLLSESTTILPRLILKFIATLFTKNF